MIKKGFLHFRVQFTKSLVSFTNYISIRFVAGLCGKCSGYNCVSVNKTGNENLWNGDGLLKLDWKRRRQRKTNRGGAREVNTLKSIDTLTPPVDNLMWW